MEYKKAISNFDYDELKQVSTICKNDVYSHVFYNTDGWFRIKISLKYNPTIVQNLPYVLLVECHSSFVATTLKKIQFDINGKLSDWTTTINP